MTRFNLSLADARKWWGKYYSQSWTSVKRKDRAGNPIEFKLTFDEWFQIWRDSGQLHNRGCGKGQYMMTRPNDLGNYEVGNVQIRSNLHNTIESNLGRKNSPETIERMRKAALKRWRGEQAD